MMHLVNEVFLRQPEQDACLTDAKQCQMLQANFKGLFMTLIMGPYFITQLLNEQQSLTKQNNKHDATRISVTYRVSE